MDTHMRPQASQHTEDPSIPYLNDSVDFLTDEHTGEVVVCDKETGEVIELALSHRELKDPGYPLPTEARSREELIDAFKKNPLLPHRTNVPVSKSDLLHDALEKDHISLSEWKVMNWVINGLDVSHYKWTTTAELKKALNVTSAALSRLIKALEGKNLLRVIAKDRTRRGTRLLAVHPMYGFRGHLNDSWERTLLDHWYPASAPP